MKTEILDLLKQFERNLRELKKELEKLPTEQVSRTNLRQNAESLATFWFEHLCSPLEQNFGISKEIIEGVSQNCSQLHRLSRPNNLKTSYIREINQILSKFQDKFVLPIQRQPTTVFQSSSQLYNLLSKLNDATESEYLQEAIKCVQSKYFRAAIVLGWCATIDRIQKKIQAIGFDKFNSTSLSLKNKTLGKYKKWTDSFDISSLAELQEVNDAKLVAMLEALSVIDNSQGQRLQARFEERNQCAHPGQAPVDEPHVLVFFTDIVEIVLANPAFNV